MRQPSASAGTPETQGGRRVQVAGRSHDARRSLCALPGAGMGLPGLLCAKLGARRVLSSDYVDTVGAELKELKGTLKKP